MCGAFWVSPTQMNVNSNDVRIHASGQQCQVNGLHSDTEGKTQEEQIPFECSSQQI
jgi:hypothetical protein